MGSNIALVIIKQWIFMFDFPVDLSLKFMNEDKDWFCLILLVLALRIITPSRIILWFWVQCPSLEFFVCCFIRSVFIDSDTFSWLFLKFLFGTYTNQFYGFARPLFVSSVRPFLCDPSWEIMWNISHASSWFNILQWFVHLYCSTQITCFLLPLHNIYSCILFISYLHGFLRSVEITHESSCGSRGQSCHKIFGYG